MHKIVLVYQSLLGIYGDQGNSKILAKRLEWRGMDTEVVVIEPGTPVPTDGLVYLLGGGEDAAQMTAVRELTADGGLFTALDAGAALLTVCAGYQICGKTFTLGENEICEGLGLLDVETSRGPVRAVGELLTRWTKPDGTTQLLTGFENHGGYTYLGSDAAPLAEVVKGVGNANDGTEGAVQGKVIGTYPHGPVLARNPELADHILELALGQKLEPLDRASAAHAALHKDRIAAFRR